VSLVTPPELACRCMRSVPHAASVCRTAALSPPPPQSGMSFMGPWGFVMEDSMHRCRMREGFARQEEHA
jgi:hypothetical protein